MKKYLLIVSLLIVISCKKKENVNEAKNENSALSKKDSRIIVTGFHKNKYLKSIQNINRPKHTKIINSKFDL
jgi:hypothetical protein